MATTIANVATALLQECGYIQDSTSVVVTPAMVLAENGYLATTSNVAITPAIVLAENGYLAATSNVAVTAALVLAENNYVVDVDISAVNLEYLIDNAVNYINMQANTSMAALGGAGGSKTQDYDRNEATILKSLTTLMIKAYKDRSPNVSIGGISAATVLNDPQYAVHADIIKTGIQRLKTLSSTNVGYLIDNAINYVNMQANTSMSALAGGTVNVDRNEATVVKSLSALMLKASLDGGGNAVTATEVMNNPHYAVHSDIVKAGISRLQTLSTTNVGYLIDNAIGYVNGQTGLQMSLLAAGTVTLTGSQASVVKLIAGILLKVALSRGGEVSLQTLTKDPQHSIYGEMIQSAVAGLKTIKADYVEQILDDAIRYINSEADISIAALTGAAGSKSLVGTDAQVIAVKSLGKILLRDAKNEKISTIHREMVKTTIQRLRGRAFIRT